MSVAFSHDLRSFKRRVSAFGMNASDPIDALSHGFNSSHVWRVGRPLADKMKPLLGAVVVDNIGGGGALLGAAAVARARPDGYTLLLGGTLPHVNEALLKSKPLYDSVKDLDPIAQWPTMFSA